MSIKLLVRQGGGAAAEVDFVNDFTPRKGAAFFEGATPLVRMGHRWSDGEASQGEFRVVDPDATESTAGFRIRPWAEVRLTEDASGDELTLAWMRFTQRDVQRRTIYVGGDEVEHLPRLMDCNVDLRGIPFRTAWERPAETDIERLEALFARKLSGSASTAPNLFRETTDITIDSFANGHLTEQNTPVEMEAWTYAEGTEVSEVIAHIADEAGKQWGIVLHDTAGSTHKCLLYVDNEDLNRWQSTVRISDDLADWDPDHATAPTFEPNWLQGAGREADFTDTYSGVINIYGGTNDDPRTVYVETGEAPEDQETWVAVRNDDETITEGGATRHATTFLNKHKNPHQTNKVSILVKDEQAHLVRAGMALQIKSVVTNTGLDKENFKWRRVAECIVEPAADGLYWLHLSLERPRKGFGGGSGGRTQPKSTTPKPPPTCEVPAGDVVVCSYDAGGGNSVVWPGGYTATGFGSTFDTTLPGFVPYKYMGSGQTTDLIAACSLVPGNTYHISIHAGTNSQYAYYQLRYNQNAGPSNQVIASLYPNSATPTEFDIGGTFTVDPSSSEFVIVFSSTYGGWHYNEVTITEAATPPDNDEFCVDPDLPAESPYYYPSDTVDALIAQAITNAEIRKVSMTMVNASGGTLSEGDFVVPDTATDNAVTTTTDASQTAHPGGIVLEGGADGEDVLVAWMGNITALNYGGDTPVAGDYIYSSSTPGEVVLSPTRIAGAMGQIGYDGTLLIAYWWGTPDSSSGGASSIGWFNVRDYGAVGDGTTDDTSAINDAIADYNTAGGGVLYFPSGHYQTTGSLTTTTAGGLILGDGHAHRDGTTQAVSRIDCSSTSASLFTIGAHATTIRGLALVQDSAGAPSGGAGIDVTSGGHARYENLSVSNFFIGINIQDGEHWAMRGCYVYNTVSHGIKVAHTDLPDGGDWAITDSWVTAASRTDTGANAIEYVSGGGGKIVNLKVNADSGTRYTNGVSMNIPNGVVTVDLLISNCSIENVSQHAISATTTGSGTFRHINIVGNQTSFWTGTNNSGKAVSLVGAGTDDFRDVVISSNNFYGGSGTNRSAIQLTNVDNVTLVGNELSGAFTSLYSQTSSTNITEVGVTSVAADDVTITDAGGYFTGTEVEAALQELGADVVGLSGGLGGHYEVIISGTAPPVAVTNEAEDDWVYGFVPD